VLGNLRFGSELVDATTKLGPAPLCKYLKERFNELNDHVRFKDSPPVSTPTRNRRDARQGHVQLPDGGVAAPTNQDLGPRPIQSPIRNQDHIDPSAASIREYRAQSLSTTFSVADFYNPAATQLASMFPDFDTKICEVRNQTDILVEVAKQLMARCRDLTGDKEQLERVMARLVDRVPDYFNGVDEMVLINNHIANELNELLDYVGRNRVNELPINSPHPGTPDVEEAGNEENAAEEVVVPATLGKNSITRLKGAGYLGDQIQISRVSVEMHNAIPFMNARSVSGRLAKGHYFFKPEILALCGKKFARRDNCYAKFYNLVSMSLFDVSSNLLIRSSIMVLYIFNLQLHKNNTIGGAGRSVQQTVIEEYFDQESYELLKKIHPPGQGCNVLLSGEDLQYFFTSIFKPVLDYIKADAEDAALDPFGATGCLAWVVNETPAVDEVISDIALCEKFEVVSEEAELTEVPDELLLTRSVKRRRVQESDEGQGAALTESEEDEEEDVDAAEDNNDT
jgi:hypothetical protein